MSARKVDFLPEEKEELLKIFELNLSTDPEAQSLAKSLFETSVWANRWELLNPKYDTMLVHTQTYKNDVLKIAYQWGADEFFGTECRNTVKDLLIKWLNNDPDVYIGQEY